MFIMYLLECQTSFNMLFALVIRRGSSEMGDIVSVNVMHCDSDAHQLRDHTRGYASASLAYGPYIYVCVESP